MRVGLALALPLLACSSATDDAARLAAREQPVIGGRDSAAGDDGVVIVRVERPGGTSVCSGSLVAPNLLLTARHCVTATYVEDNIRCKADGSLDVPSGGALGEPVAADRVTIYLGAAPSQDAVSNLPGGAPDGVGTRIVTTSWPNVCRDDLALIVLDREVSAPIVPLDLRTQVSKATRVSTVGYGLTENSRSGELWSDRKRRDGVPVKYVDTLPNTFGIGRAVCQGDSGGPAFDSISGGVVGVYSLGFPGVDVSSCSSENALNYYTRLSAYEPLLRQGFDAAEQPFPEPAPGGEGGAPNAEGGAESNAEGGASTAGDGAAAGGAEPDDEGPRKEPGAGDGGGCNSSGARASWPSLLLAFGALAARSRRRRQHAVAAQGPAR